MVPGSSLSRWLASSWSLFGTFVCCCCLCLVRPAALHVVRVACLVWRGCEMFVVIDLSGKGEPGVSTEPVTVKSSPYCTVRYSTVLVVTVWQFRW